MRYAWPRRSGPERPDQERHDVQCEAEYMGFGVWTECQCEKRRAGDGKLR